MDKYFEEIRKRLTSEVDSCFRITNEQKAKIEAYYTALKAIDIVEKWHQEEVKQAKKVEQGNG